MTKIQEESDTIRQLIQWAEKQELVRAVLLTSSLTRPDGPVDVLSDYDVDLYVSDTQPFAADETWRRDFGPIMVQYGDESEWYGLRTYSRMVVYEDGTKIDFGIAPVDVLRKIAGEPRLPAELDSGYRVLLDKDHLTDKLASPTYRAYIPAKPTEKEFQRLVEDFWWETTYVAKNLWRDDLFGAKFSLDNCIRFDVLRPMLEWLLEIEHNWSVSPGVHGRRLKQHLKPEVWSELESTYAGASIEDNWQSLFKTCEFFRRIAKSVADQLGYRYPQDMDDRVMHYLLKIRNLEHTESGKS